MLQTRELRMLGESGPELIGIPAKRADASMGLELLIAKLARYAAMADRGVGLGDHGDIDQEVVAHHKGSAKAYRHAIELVIQCQRDIDCSAAVREQQAA